jgi:hypothetical protein
MELKAFESMHETISYAIELAHSYAFEPHISSSNDFPNNWSWSLKMIGVHCLRTNGDVSLQGNPNPKDVHGGSTFWRALSTHHFSHELK